MVVSFTKKAQVTIFVVLGILLLAGVFFFLTIQKDDSSVDFEKGSDLKAVLENINSYSTNCFSDVVEMSIERVLAQGGYYNLSGTPSDDIGSFTIPYYLEDDEVRIPSEEEVIEAIRLMIVNNFDSCVDNYSAFDDFDVTLKKSETSADVELDEGILISLNPNVDVVHDDSNISSENLSEFVPLNIESLLSAANEMVESHIGFDEGYLSVTRVSDASDNNNVVFDSLSSGDDSLLLLRNNEESNYVLLFLMNLN